MCECCGGDCKLMDKESMKDDLLEAYEKISETFEGFTQLMRSKVPYESWPKHLQIGGINPDLLGPAYPPGTHIKLTGSHMPPIFMQIPEYTEHTSNQLEENMISRIEDIGRAQEKLKMILDNDIFDMTSKHNMYWKSEDPIQAEKLDYLRRKFVSLNDDLNDLWGILRKEEE